MQHTESRTIFHVDVNSAFLSWSALKRLKEDPGSVDLRTIPSAVGGDVQTRHGIITAKSIPAKKYDIHTADPVVKALQKCPQLVVVPADFQTYRTYSHRLMDLLSEYTPLLQQVSIDEAYLDVSHLVPADDRTAAIALADRIRTHVFLHLGFTVNVGISSNKLLAKMASDFRKPDMTHTLYPDEIKEKMWPLPIGDLYGCGRATAGKLQSIGIHTIGEAAVSDLRILQSLLGEKGGLYIHESANGRSHSAVKPEKEKAKSISNEITMAEDIGPENFAGKGIPVIRTLSEKVSGRLHKTGMVAQTVTFQVKTSDFQRYSRQTSLEDPCDDRLQIEKAALLLAERLLTSSGGLFDSGKTIRLIGVGVSRLTEPQAQQMDLFTWARETSASADHNPPLNKEQKQQIISQKSEKLNAMLASVNARFGDGRLRKGMSVPQRTAEDDSE